MSSDQILANQTKYIDHLQSLVQEKDAQIATLQQKIAELDAIKGTPHEPILCEVGDSKSAAFKNHRLMGSECHGFGEALGITKGWRKLVLEFEVDKPVTIYVQHFLTDVDLGQLGQKFAGLIQGHVVKELTVDEHGNVFAGNLVEPPKAS